MAESEKVESLKKMYAEMILTAAREAAARVLSAESKARRYEQDLACTRDEAARLFERSRQLMDAKEKEAENRMLNQKMKYDEIENQLNEAEMVILDLRAELEETQDRLGREKKKARYSRLQNENECPIQNENESLFQNENEYVLQNENECLLQNENERLLLNENESLLQNENECLLQNDNESLLHNENESVLQNDNESLLQNENESLLIQNQNESLPQNENESHLQNENENVTLESDVGGNEVLTASLDSGLELMTVDANLSGSPLGSGLELVTGSKNRSGLEVDTLSIKSSTPDELTKNMLSEYDVHSSNDHSVSSFHVKETELLTSSLNARQEPTAVKEPGLVTTLDSGLKLIAETYSSSSSDEEDEPNLSYCCPACAAADAEERSGNQVCPKVETSSGPRSNSTNFNDFMSVESASESEEEVQHEKHEPVSVVRRSSRKRTFTPLGNVLRTSRKRTSKPSVDVHQSTRKSTAKPWGDVRRSTRKRTIKPCGDVTSKLGVRSSRQFKKHGMTGQQISICKSNKVNDSFKSGQDTFPRGDGTEIEDNLGQEFPSRKFKLIEDLQNDMKLTNVSVEQACEDPQEIVGSLDVVAEQDDTNDLQKDTALIDAMVEHDELAAMVDLTSLSTIVCEAIGDAVIIASDARNAVSNASDARNAVSNASDARNAVSNASDARNAVSNATDARNAVSNASDARNADTKGKPYITYSRRKKKTNPVPEKTSSSGEAVREVDGDN